MNVPNKQSAASPLDLTLRPPEGATRAQCVEMWIDLMNVCDELLLARLRREVGPEGDVMAAYREWYRRDREEHERALIRMLERLVRAVQKHGC